MVSHLSILICNMGHSATVRSRSGDDVSDVLHNFLYISTCQKIHTQFFLDFFYFSFLRYHFFQKNKKNHDFLKSETNYINLIKYMKIS